VAPPDPAVSPFDHFDADGSLYSVSSDCVAMHIGRSYGAGYVRTPVSLSGDPSGSAVCKTTRRVSASAQMYSV